MVPYSPVSIEGEDRPGDWVILCDHATNIVPEDVSGDDLGLPAEDMARHIAWDPGALGVAAALAKALNAPLIHSNFSRLVIDPNRAADDPTLVRKIYDGSVIPGNRAVDAAEKARRIETLYQPYHDAVDRLIDAKGAPGLLSIHSYTPQLVGGDVRPWFLGLLWDQDDRLFAPLWNRLAREDFVSGDNKPYTGQLAGDCMWMHGTSRGLPHLLIEVRNDLIETEAQQATWGADIARWMTEALAEEAATP
ncbi:MAG: N-formylglutamate amidohydrolase [Pseudomonadota bacterium]